MAQNSKASSGVSPQPKPISVGVAPTPSAGSEQNFSKQLADARAVGPKPVASAGQVQPRVGTPVGGLPRPTPFPTPTSSAEAQAQTQSVEKNVQSLAIQRGKASQSIESIISDVEKLYSEIKPPSKKNYIWLASFTSTLDFLNVAIEDTGGDAWSAGLLLAFRYLVIKPANFSAWYLVTRRDKRQANLLIQLGGVVEKGADKNRQKSEGLRRDIERVRQTRVGGQNSSQQLNLSRGASTQTSRASVSKITSAIRHPGQINWVWLISLTPLADNIPVATYEVWRSYQKAKHNFDVLRAELYQLAEQEAEQYIALQEQYAALVAEEQAQLAT